MQTKMSEAPAPDSGTEFETIEVPLYDVSIPQDTVDPSPPPSNAPPQERRSGALAALSRAPHVHTHPSTENTTRPSSHPPPTALGGSAAARRH